MKAYKWSILILVLIVGLTACKKNEDDEIPPVIHEGSGSILVNVFVNGQPVSDAVVTTEPESNEGTTNASGSVLIENVSEGIYHVFATNNEIGSGSGAVVVDPGGVSNLTINLIPGVFDGPMVDIISLAPQTVAIGDTVTVTALVFDIVDENEDINFEWSTDVDGVISNEGVGESGNAILDYVFETLGQRTLTVTATNSEGDSNSDQVIINVIELPDPVVLEPIEVQNLELQLNWSQSDASNFIAYRVYRQVESDFTLVQSIYNINTTNYSDSDINIDSEYSYRISVYLNNGYEIMSNTASWQYDGVYIDIGTGLDRMLHDPNNPIIYGLDTDNNSLVIINTELEEVVNSFYVGSIPTDMDFSLDNQLLYIANFGSTEISVVDLASQSVQSTFFVETEIGTWGGNPYTLAVLANGLLAFSSSGSFNDIKLVDITNGNNVYTTSTTFRSPYLSANSDGTKLIAGETDSNWSELHRFNVNNDELVLVESSGSFADPEPQVFITNNDEFAFYAGRKFLVNNLPSILGSFNDEIYAISYNGSRALGEDHVFSGNDYSIVAGLPISTKVSVFGNDDTTAWLYHEPSARLYKVTVE